jgi:DNA mismatch repair protein MutS2
VLVITGPNTGGKTVALKSFGLMALMCQSGLLIPVAEGSRLPCFRAVYADVGDEQSIERNLSTFSAHIANLSEIVASTEQPALALLDEPGVGTDPEEGAALGIGLMRVLEAHGTRVVVTTHYAAIKVFGLSNEACVTAAVEFDVDALQPHYRLVYHSVGESLAIPIARRLGMPEAVLQAAESARSEQARALAAAMSKLEDSRRSYEDRLAEAEARRAGASEAEKEAARLLDDLREKRRRRWSDELEQAREFVRKLRDEGRELLAALQRGEADRKQLAQFVAQQDEAIRAHEAEIKQPESPTSRWPQIGDQVEVGGQGIRGELVSISGERAWIQRGSLRFEVPSAALRYVGNTAAPAKQVEVHVQRPEISPEISLIGMRAKEAIDQLEHFLDRAAQSHHSSVRIVHGVGSGALRRAVADYLSTSPYCSAFRSGEAGEGGAGVTVAELAG